MNMFGGRLFSQPKIQAFGLDIGDRSLKAALLSARQGTLALESLGRLAVPPGVVEKGKIVDEEKLGQLILQLLRAVDGRPIKTPFVVASLPEEESFVRVIKVPAAAEEELAELVRKESESNIPVYLDEIYLDWQPIQSSVGKASHLDVLMAAVRQSVVDAYVACFKKIHLQPVALEVESFAIARALTPADEKTAPSLIIDLGGAKTTFIVVSQGTVRFTATIPFQSDALSRELAEELHIPLAEAERLKMEVGFDSARQRGRVARLLQSRLNGLVEQIQKYIDFYDSHPSHEHTLRHTIEKVILSGGGAKLLGLETFLAKALKMTVVVGNPWLNILMTPLQQVVAATYRESTHYTTALGLALRGARLD